MNVLIYSKKNCPSCAKARVLLNTKGVKYTESIVGENIIREEFVTLFPDVRSVPFIIIDGVKIGGFDQLREYFETRPEFLAG